MAFRFDPTLNWNVVVYLVSLLIAGTMVYSRFDASINSLVEATKENRADISAQQVRTLALEVESAADRSTMAAVLRDIGLIRGAQAETNSLLRELLLAAAGK